MLQAWPIIGWVLTALAAGAILFAFVPLRWRSPSCPKCRYDFSGTLKAAPAGPWICPECGRVTKRERDLRRVRRRGRLMWGVPLALLLFASGFVARRAPEIAEYGWWAAVPRPVLLVGFLVGYEYWEEPRWAPPPRRIPKPNGALWSEVVRLRYIEEPVGWWPGEGWLAEHLLNQTTIRKNVTVPTAQVEMLARVVALTTEGIPDHSTPMGQAMVLRYRFELARRKGEPWAADAALSSMPSARLAAPVTPLVLAVGGAGEEWRGEVGFADGSTPRVIGRDSLGDFGNAWRLGSRAYFGLDHEEEGLFMRVKDGDWRTVSTLPLCVSRVTFDGRKAYQVSNSAFQIILDSQDYSILRSSGAHWYSSDRYSGSRVITIRYQRNETVVAAILAVESERERPKPRRLLHATQITRELANLEPTEGW